MKKTQKSLSLFEFQQRFTTDNQCLEYLSAKKWKNGFVCPKCGHTRYCASGTPYSRQCTRCKMPSITGILPCEKVCLLWANHCVYNVYIGVNAHIFDNLILRMIRAKPYYLYD